jgi:AraC-like DNA-binding protein
MTEAQQNQGDKQLEQTHGGELRLRENSQARRLRVDGNCFLAERENAETLRGREFAFVTAYEELLGDLSASPDDTQPAALRRVAFSDLTRGTALSHPADGLWIKYVARGAVLHRFESRTFLVRAGQFLVAPEHHGSELEIRRSGETSTVGLCLFIPRAEALDRNPADEPLVFSARCSALGRELTMETAEIARHGYARQRRAPVLLRRIEQHLDGFLSDTAEQLDSLSSLRSATRHEVVRRLSQARGYLHDVVERPVTLEELSRAAGMSRFQLLRQFKVCYGDTPATYHRKLRLELVRAEVLRSVTSTALVAQKYGFADGSSFSHVYRRAFGRPAFRSQRSRAY